MFNLAQFIQCCIVPAGYFFIMPYTIYTVKMHYAGWEHDLNYVRIWLLIEVVYFFFWILGGVMFVIYAYIVKFKAISKNELVLQMDDNVWNDKDTDDFLRYLKQEYFLMSYIIAILATEFFTGFTDIYRMNVLGPRDFYPVGLIYTVLIINRSMGLIYTSIMLKNNDKIADDYVGEENKFSKRSIGRIIIQLTIYSIIATLYFSNDRLEKYNHASKVWIQTELISIVLEFPAVMIQSYFLKKKYEAIQKSLQIYNDGDQDLDKKSDAASDQKLEGVSPSLNADMKRIKSLIQIELEKKISDKSVLEFEEDFFSMTVFCYLKCNQEKYMINPSKQS